MIKQAGDLARIKCYDEARELAITVLREDARNTKALWIVACVTASLNERYNSLRALLRIQPDNEAAQEMLGVTERQLRTAKNSSVSIESANRKRSGNVIRSISSD